MNYVELFDQNGGLKTEDDFIDKYKSDLIDIATSDYEDKMKANPDIKNLYEKYFEPSTFTKSVRWFKTNDENRGEYVEEKMKDLYANAKKSILSIWRVPPEEAKSIASDKEKFKKWAKENGVNKFTIQQQLIKDADDFANLRQDFQTFVFSEGQKDILGKVLQNSYDKDNKLQLKLVDEINWKRDENGLKAISFKTKDEEIEDIDTLGDVIYELPPDPAKDGIIIKSKGKRYIMPPDKLGDLLSPSVKELCQRLRVMYASRHEQYDMAYALPGVFNKIENGGKFSGKEKKALVAIGIPKIPDSPNNYSPEEKENIKQRVSQFYSVIQQNLTALNANIMQLRANTTIMMRDVLSLLYKPNKD